ncbi:MAG: MSCRAMM family protein [Sporichthyaceae bacterium]
MELDTSRTGESGHVAAPEGSAMLRGVVHDGDGGALADAHLTVVAPNGAQVASARADATGALRVDLPPGRYLIAVTAPGHAAKAGVIDLAAIGAEVDVTLHRESELRGVVRNGADPADSALVTLLDESGRLIHTVRTDATGTYCLPAPEPGTYTLLAVTPGTAPVTKTLRWPHDPPVCDLTLSARARVYGTVRAPSGAPLSGARVRLLDGDGAEVDSRVTEADGVFEFPGLPDGRYTVWANGFPATSQLLRLGEDEPGRSEVVADILLHPEGVPAGSVALSKDRG